jgi:phosphoserine phosphatase
MRLCSKRLMLAVVGLGLLMTGCEKAPDTQAAKQAVTTDPMPSWNEGATKEAIIGFVSQVTTEGGPNFVQESDRIATFDNDGTLWVEQPDYTEAIFTEERIRQMAQQHPEWKTKQPFASVLNHDAKAMAASGEKGAAQLLVVTHTGMTMEEFDKTVSDWIGTAKHPKFQRAYTQCIYQPMLEVLRYLRANGFKTYIVSGGEQEFMRPWTDKTYGIPPEQVVGTQIRTEFKDGTLMRMPQVESIDDGPGKPVNIGRLIGKRPIAAFGNSDGDQQMLEYATVGPGTRLAVLVHHTDAEREYAYDRDSKVGRLDKALDEAGSKHWTVVDMKSDWKSMFPSRDTP